MNNWMHTHTHTVFFYHTIYFAVFSKIHLYILYSFLFLSEM